MDANCPLENQRKIWLAGLDVGSKIIFRSTYSSKVVRVDRTTKTMLILSNGFRASRKTGDLIGEVDRRREISQLLTRSPQFQPGTDFDVGYTLRADEERGVAQCIRDMIGLT